MSLKAFELHNCILCPYKSIRKDMKKHLTSTGKKGPRCPGLKNVIPSDVWVNQIENRCKIAEISLEYRHFTKKSRQILVIIWRLWRERAQVYRNRENPKSLKMS